MRAASWDTYPKRQVDGAWLCRWCSSPLTGRRTAFCGQACEDEVRIRCQPSYARALVLRRDGGVCCRCKLNTEALRNAIEDLALSWRLAGRSPLLARAIEAVIVQLAERGFDLGGNWRWGPVRALWEADHIVPVIRGGGGCGLENYRTLCTPCHKIVSARLARSRADKRKGQPPLFS